jgi:DNA-binding transcriptional LysR family regulator
LDRQGKSVTLTLAGEQLLEHAEGILEEMARAREGLGRMGQWGRGRLRIGTSTTVCTYLLPSVLRRFRARFPQHAITIVPADAAEMLHLVHAGRVDLALALEPKPEESIVFEPVFEDELLFVMSPRHPWAVAGSVERGTIARQNYVLYHRRSYTFRLVDDYFRRERISLRSFIELGSMEAIKELVKLDLGVSILAPWIAREELRSRELTALPLGRRKLRRRWGLIRNRSRTLDLAEETLVRLCHDAAAETLGEDVPAVDSRNGGWALESHG